MSGHAVAASALEPDLSALDPEQASALEQIAGEAVIGFGLRRAELRGRCRQAMAASRYAVEALVQIEQIRRLERMARCFLAAAHARSRAAERERCLAVRAVQTLAGAVLEPARSPLSPSGRPIQLGSAGSSPDGWVASD